MPNDNLFIDQLSTGYQYHYWREGVVIRVERIGRNGHGSLWGELSVERPANTPLLTAAKIELLNRKSRLDLGRDIIKSRAPTDEFVNYELMVEEAVTDAIRKYRAGEPAVLIRDIKVEQKTSYRLYPLIPERQLTIIYGKGGGGKSCLACLFAVMIQDGIPLAHLSPNPGNVLYLDYEADASTLKSRIDAMRLYFQAGADADTDIRYRRSGLPLVEDFDAVSDIVIKNGIEAVIVDGFGYCISGDTQKEERVLQTVGLMRQLGVTLIVIDHEAKLQEGGSTGPFGSVYKYNAGRSIFHIESEKDGDILRIGLQHVKMNSGKLLEPLAFELEFVNATNDPDRLLEIKTQLIDASTMAAMYDKLARWQRIKDLLLTEGEMTIKDIASALSDQENTIRAEVNRCKNVFIKTANKKWGVKLQ